MVKTNDESHTTKVKSIKNFKKSTAKLPNEGEKVRKKLTLWV